MESQTSYLIEDTGLDPGIHTLREVGSTGYSSLLISRQRPGKLKEKFGLEDTSFIWLTSNIEKVGSGVTLIGPTAITKLSTSITGFMGENEKAVVLLAGMEYLSTQNGFKAIINLAYLLNDKVMTGDNILLVTLNPGAFSQQELNQLRSELRPLGDR